MPHAFPCPHCHRQLKVQDDVLGKPVRCPACKMVLTVPMPQLVDAKGQIVARPHRGVTVLTLGILGLCFAFCPIAGWIFSGCALEMAREDLEAMAGGTMDRSGLDLTQSGRILGHAGALISSIAAIVWAWMLFTFFTNR